MSDNSALLAYATIGLGGATVFLAVITWYGLRQQANQFREAERNAVLPFPVIEGFIFFPEAEIGGSIKPSYLADPLRGQSVRVHNLGRGPALYLQWSLTPQTSSGTPASWERIRRNEIRPIHVPEHETHELWHPTDTGPEMQHPMDGERIVLWYDDTFGHHYSCSFERQGRPWIERSRNQDQQVHRHWWQWQRKRKRGAT